jgi:hypothetical protein
MIDQQRIVILIIAAFILLALEEMGIPPQLLYLGWLFAGFVFGWKIGRR